ncbi:DUF4123 domain-containing protein [Pseudomonas baetica]|uniref:DUF4123 domain-containing protein n=1 Tax=Pseudomonas baetica TaxID=674054 RepID=UPI003EF02AB2
MQEIYEQWLDQLEGLSRAANLNHVDLIVDQAGSGIPLLPGLGAITPALPWFSFFNATPEDTLLPQAPILMRINLDDWRHKAWLEEIIEHMGHMPRLVLLISPIPFDVLSKTLQGLSQLEWGGQSGLLRFYDPRVLPELLASVLDPEQKKRFLEQALFWSWLDRDQRIVWQPGTYGSNQVFEEAISPVVLTDSQFDRLGCISDAQKLFALAWSMFPELSNEECFSRCNRVALLASDENYFGDLEAYAEGKFSEQKNRETFDE